MLNSPLRKFHDCLLTHIKTAWFLAPLTVLGKWEVLAGLQIYPKKVLRGMNMAFKQLKKVRKARK